MTYLDGGVHNQETYTPMREIEIRRDLHPHKQGQHYHPGPIHARYHFQGQTTYITIQGGT